MLSLNLVDFGDKRPLLRVCVRNLTALRLRLIAACFFAAPLASLIIFVDVQSVLAVEKYRASLDRCQKLIGSRHISEARAMLRQMAAQSDAPADVYNLYASSYLEAQGLEAESSDYRQAVDGLKIAIERDPENGHSYCLLSFASNLKGDYRAGVLFATKALSTKSPDFTALRQRAIAYSHLKNDRGALADMLELLKRGFTTTMNYMLTGDIQRGLGLYKDAAENYALALQKGTAFHQRIFSDMVKSLILSHQVDKAKSAITERLKNDPDSAELLDMRATIEANQKDYTSAANDLNRALKVTDTALYHAHLADVYSKMGKKDLAAHEQGLGQRKEAFNLFP